MNNKNPNIISYIIEYSTNEGLLSSLHYPNKSFTNPLIPSCSRFLNSNEWFTMLKAFLDV